MIRFNTETGSSYEVDTNEKRIRRVMGTHAPTPRQGNDKEWKSYHWISDIELRKPVLIAWDAEGKATETSLVTIISEE